MRKMIFTLVLAIVSSVWMTSKAMCQVSTCTCLFDDPPVAISGILQLVPLPCPESTEDIPCPTCLTIALNANEQLYYLNGLNDNLNALLDTLVYPVNATVTGHVYTALEGGLAISVQDISLHASLPSLCDEWNVLTTVIYEDSTRYFTFSQKLTTDTIIGENMYVKSEVEHKYNGAYREGENRDIYFVPAAMNKEFLVYAWNAQVGDTLYNILVSSSMYGLQYSNKAVVREIKETTPRTFIVDYEYIYNRKIDSADTIWWEYQWIEGIGMTCGASGDLCPFDKCQDSIKSEILCAYKNGEQVYSSSKSERYGCEFNGILPSTKPYHLCDEWNVLHEPFSSFDRISTIIYSLTTDTLIQGKQYAKLEEQEGSYTHYKGAMREGTNRDIYYIPAGSTHEYLIYAFNAKVGDKLTNLWIGGYYSQCPNGYNGIVQAISDGTPRKFTISIDMDVDEDPYYTVPRKTEWIEGVGFLDNPTGPLFSLGAAVDYGVETILCAYKNGEQVYTSAKGEQYGCEYSESIIPKIVEIPLYKLSGEEAIPATVEPIKSQIHAYIRNGYSLTMITDDANEKISYTLTKYEPNASSVKKSDTFTHLGFVSLSEPGHYMLRMKDPAWDYYACGWFHYSEQEIEVISLPQSSDSIPLYVQDDPGSSTVDPVDPNQVVATIEDGQLTIQENMGTTMTCTLNNESANNIPNRRNAPQAQVFSDAISVQITESGDYLLQLTNPSWNYAIVGRFNYVAQGIEITEDQLPATNKILRNGRLLILRGDKTYTLTGQEVIMP